MDREEMLNLLLRPSWSAKEIQKYVNLSGSPIGITKATEIKKQLEREGHQAPYRLSAVRVEAVMNYFGRNRDSEIKLLKEVIGK